MDINFLIHNSHIDDPDKFEVLDPHLRNLSKQAYVFNSSLITEFPSKIPGIYTLSGSRQIGKTTLLKQWMWQLLQSGVSNKSITFLTGEIIEDSHALISTIQNILTEMPNQSLRFIIIDEISYVKEWDKAVKYLADAGSLQDVVLLLTGSDMTFLKEARMRFPGRRGVADIQDFHLFPLSFKEFVDLKYAHLKTKQRLSILEDAFNDYLVHGGYLTAINDIKKHGKILKSTVSTYSDWIRGDILKRGKRESFLKEILSAILKSYGSQVTWNSLAQSLSIEHPKTVHEYCEILESMDAIFVQHALLEHKLQPAPKKAKKIQFADPFIYYAVYNWCFPEKNPPLDCISYLVETIVVNHFRRFYPTFYIKSDGEVDIAYIKENTFWPVEIKWTTQLRPKDLKQILKYDRGIVLTKSKINTTNLGIEAFSIPLFLYSEF